MATSQVETKTIPPATSHSTDLPPPPYDDSTVVNGDRAELDVLTPSTNSSDVSLPQYEAVEDADGSSASGSGTSAFHPTRSFQIEAPGRPLISLPLPQRPGPIPIYAVTPSGDVSGLIYESIRPSHGSGNSLLVRADAPGEPAVCATTYRFGPNRPPSIRLLDGERRDTASESDGEAFDVLSAGLATRAQNIRTHLGTFQWRYAGKAERRAANADSLLVLDKVTRVTNEKGKPEERRRLVARLVRNDEFRAEGSRSSTAGNGGRLLMDLTEWADRKAEVQQVEAFVVASCLVMLKKETDRRRVQQGVALGVIVGSG